MGNKAAKQYYLKKKYGVIGSEENSSDEDLAEFLAALSNMAHKGNQSPHRARVTRDDISLGGIHKGSPRATPSRSGSTLREKRKRMSRSRAVSDDSEIRRSTTAKDNNHASQDWAEMREWLVWCMQSNLKDDMEGFRANSIESQSSFESTTET